MAPEAERRIETQTRTIEKGGNHIHIGWRWKGWIGGEGLGNRERERSTVVLEASSVVSERDAHLFFFWTSNHGGKAGIGTWQTNSDLHPHPHLQIISPHTILLGRSPFTKKEKMRHVVWCARAKNVRMLLLTCRSIPYTLRFYLQWCGCALRVM